MKGTRNLGILIILGLVLILGIWGCSGYNALVKEDETVKNSWNNVQSAYQRRADLFQTWLILLGVKLHLNSRL